MTFKYTGDNFADGWECESESGAELIIDNGGVDEIDLKVKLTWWVQYRRYEGEERQVEILTFAINGFPMMDKVSKPDLERVEGVAVPIPVIMRALAGAMALSWDVALQPRLELAVVANLRTENVDVSKC